MHRHQESHKGRIWPRHRHDSHRCISRAPQFSHVLQSDFQGAQVPAPEGSPCPVQRGSILSRQNGGPGSSPRSPDVSVPLCPAGVSALLESCSYCEPWCCSEPLTSLVQPPLFSRRPEPCSAGQHLGARIYLFIMSGYTNYKNEQSPPALQSLLYGSCLYRNAVTSWESAGLAASLARSERCQGRAFKGQSVLSLCSLSLISVSHCGNLQSRPAFLLAQVSHLLPRAGCGKNAPWLRTFATLTQEKSMRKAKEKFPQS